MLSPFLGLDQSLLFRSEGGVDRDSENTSAGEGVGCIAEEEGWRREETGIFFAVSITFVYLALVWQTSSTINLLIASATEIFRLLCFTVCFGDLDNLVNYKYLSTFPPHNKV